jgi:hypothetical protein
MIPQAFITEWSNYVQWSTNGQVGQSPTQKQFLQNLEAKMSNAEFLGDIVALVRPDEKYNPVDALNW